MAARHPRSRMTPAGSPVKDGGFQRAPCPGMQDERAREVLLAAPGGNRSVPPPPIVEAGLGYMLGATGSAHVLHHKADPVTHPIGNGIVIEVVGRHMQPTRAATEALFMLLTHAMDDLGYRRMQWRCNSLNVKSRSAAQRLGFRSEGVFYNHQILKGRNRDTAWYSILDDEWPGVREIIKTWLDDGNFDAAGNAYRSLSEMMQHRGRSRRG
jgi:hypothetical protein